MKIHSSVSDKVKNAVDSVGQNVKELNPKSIIDKRANAKKLKAESERLEKEAEQEAFEANKAKAKAKHEAEQAALEAEKKAAQEAAEQAYKDSLLLRYESNYSNFGLQQIARNDARANLIEPAEHEAYFQLESIVIASNHFAQIRKRKGVYELHTVDNDKPALIKGNAVTMCEIVKHLGLSYA